MAIIYNISVAPKAQPYNDKDEGPIRADGKFRVQYVTPMGIIGTRYYAAGEYLTFPEAPATLSQYGVFEEWNYDSIQVYQPLVVGAVYDTTDHNTHVLLLIREGALERTLQVTNVEGGIDWGDGTYTPGTTVTHTYTEPGRYWLTIEGNFDKASTAQTTRPVFGDCIEIWVGSAYTGYAAYFTGQPTSVCSFSPVMPGSTGSSTAVYTNQGLVPVFVFPKTVKKINYYYATGDAIMSIPMGTTMAFYHGSNAPYPKTEIILPKEPSSYAVPGFGQSSFTSNSYAQIHRIIYGPGYKQTNSSTVPITDEVWFTNHGTLYWQPFSFNPGKIVLFSDAWANDENKSSAESYCQSNNITIQYLPI